MIEECSNRSKIVGTESESNRINEFSPVEVVYDLIWERVSDKGSSLLINGVKKFSCREEPFKIHRENNTDDEPTSNYQTSGVQSIIIRISYKPHFHLSSAI